MPLEGRGVAGEPSFTDRAHQIEAAAWSVVFVASDNVRRTRFQTQTAVNASEKLVFFVCEGGSELG